LDEFRSEASTLKNQDLTVRRLEERNRALEVQMEQRAAALVSSKLTSMEEESVRAMELLKERERYLVTQLDATAITVTALRRETDTAQNEMFELKAAYEEERAARQAEMELLQTDLEAAEARLLAVDRERQRATTADARGRGDGEGDGNGPVAAAAGGVSLEKFREVESAAEEHERRVSLLLREAAAAEGAAAAAAAEVRLNPKAHMLLLVVLLA
jgi:homeobox protein cut-like